MSLTARRDRALVFIPTKEGLVEMNASGLEGDR
jgi:hypothetical protein